MGQLASSRFIEDLLQNPAARRVGPFTEGILWQAVQGFTEARATAIGLPNGLVISSRASWHQGTTLAPIKDAIRRLEQSRIAAETMGNQPIVFACTSARGARSLAADDDPRDRRYLNGLRTIDDFHVYCGGVDAAVSRGLAYVPHADVICYRASRFDLGEAQRFASFIRASFPDKPLGMGFPLQDKFDHAGHSQRLVQLGYGYSFLTFAESLVFPTFPEDRPRVFFDDIVELSDAAALAERRRVGPPSPSADLRLPGRTQDLHRSRRCD